MLLQTSFWLATRHVHNHTKKDNVPDGLQLWLALPEKDEALRLYTIGSAWFSNEENVKGRIAPGQYADLALLTDDYFNVPEEEIKHIESVFTVVNGRIVYGDKEYINLTTPSPVISPAWSPVSEFGGHWRSKKIVDGILRLAETALPNRWISVTAPACATCGKGIATRSSFPSPAFS